jgi:hypothetical protein
MESATIVIFEVLSDNADSASASVASIINGLDFSDGIANVMTEPGSSFERDDEDENGRSGDDDGNSDDDDGRGSGDGQENNGNVGGGENIQSEGDDINTGHIAATSTPPTPTPKRQRKTAVPVRKSSAAKNNTVASTPHRGRGVDLVSYRQGGGLRDLEVLPEKFNIILQKLKEEVDISQPFTMGTKTANVTADHILRDSIRFVYHRRKQHVTAYPGREDKLTTVRVANIMAEWGILVSYHYKQEYRRYLDNERDVDTADKKSKKYVEWLLTIESDLAEARTQFASGLVDMEKKFAVSMSRMRKKCEDLVDARTRIGDGISKSAKDAFVTSQETHQKSANEMRHQIIIHKDRIKDLEEELRVVQEQRNFHRSRADALEKQLDATRDEAKKKKAAESGRLRAELEKEKAKTRMREETLKNEGQRLKRDSDAFQREKAQYNTLLEAARVVLDERRAAAAMARTTATPDEGDAA